MRSTFFVSMQPGEFHVDRLLGMSRIFNGGPRAITRTIQTKDGLLAPMKPIPVGQPLTFLELEHPELKLPEREKNLPLWELGRLHTTKKAAANSSLDLVRHMSDYFLNMGEKGNAYIDAGAGAKALYHAMGAQDFGDGAPLAAGKDHKPVWVLVTDTRYMMKYYGRQKFKTLIERKVPSSRADNP